MAAATGPSSPSISLAAGWEPSVATAASRTHADCAFPFPRGFAFAPDGRSLEYDSTSGRLLLRTVKADGSVRFRSPRGLRFGPDGNLYCVAPDEVVCFEFETGAYAGAIVSLSDLFGQALEFFD